MLRSLLLFAALLCALPAAAQPLAVGQLMPGGDYALTGADGSGHTLASLAGENGLVVVFWSNVCPWTDRYEDRLVDLAREYIPAGVGFVAVNANDSTRFPDENRATMRLTAARAGFSFPYVEDGGGRLAAALGARNTPQVFFFDSSRTLRYEGAIDSSPADPARVDAPYLRLAMDFVLAGESVAVQRTNALGCSIRVGS